MNLLLDTHVWLRQLLAPETLSAQLRAVLGDPDHAFHLSSISVWETLVLIRKGRVLVDREPKAWVEEALQKSPTIAVPITHDIATRSANLRGYDNPDPADRFLIATCLERQLAMATLDESIRNYPAVETIPR